MFRLLLIIASFLTISCVAYDQGGAVLNTTLPKGKIFKVDYKIDHFKKTIIPEITPKTYKTVFIKSPEDLKEKLIKNQLWDIFKGGEIYNFLIKNFPKNLNKMGIRDKKRLFFHSMIPMILTVQNEIKEERKLFLSLHQKYKVELYDDQFISNLKYRDHIILKYLTKKYRAKSYTKLIKRIDIVPVSLVLAQAGIESAWGQSRFAIEGNNLFGVWTFSKKGLKPKYRKRGKKHRVAQYDSLIDSVRDYMLKLNRVKAYRRLRNIRLKTKNSIYLAKGLKHYSSRKDAYVKDVIKMIVKNRLQKYDTNTLSTVKIASLLPNWIYKII